MMNGLTNTTVCQNIESMQKYGANQKERNILCMLTDGGTPRVNLMLILRS